MRFLAVSRLRLRSPLAGGIVLTLILLGVLAAGAGDINGDGRADVIVGAIWADNNARTDSGSAYVIFGQETPNDIDTGNLGTAGFRIDGTAADDNLGFSAAGAGDINGDGRADVIVGALWADNNARTDSGSAYVVLGFGTPTLDYPDPIAATVGQPHVPMTPQVAHTGPTAFTVTPALPAGLHLDADTGVISGTPTVAGDTTHQVTMTDLAGTAQTQVQITIDAPATPNPGTPAGPKPGAGTTPDPAALVPAARCVAATERQRRTPSGEFALSAGQLCLGWATRLP